jgi:hypothetical protein
MLIGTDRFRSVLEATRRIVGVDDLRWAEVPHPLGSLLTHQLRQRAREAIDQFEVIVVAGAPTGPPRAPTAGG